MAGLNGGFTNWARHQMLAPITGAGNTVELPNGLHVNLLTTNPTSAGSSSGGLNSCVEWSLARQAVNDEGTSDPQFIRQSGDNGGWEMALQGTVEWDAATTAALAGNTTIVGVGVFDASTSGNLVAWAELASPRVVPVGGVWSFLSDKLRINMFQDLTD